MEIKNQIVSFDAKIKPFERINDEFLKCKVYVCALGKNRNLSYISREAADDALFSLYNVPIIGHMYQNTEDGSLHMGSHDMLLEKNDNGELVYRSLCVPYGVVPQQDNVQYEDVVEPDGRVRTYIVAVGILWIGRFPELMDAAYDDDWLFSQSMEINVRDYAPLDEDPNYTNLLKYTYSALCLLGKSDDAEYNVEPCFPEAHVESNYELEQSNLNFAKMMEEFKTALSECFSNNTCGKEEKTNMTNEIRDAILAEYGISLEDLSFEIGDDMTEELFREKVAEFAQSLQQKDDPANDPIPEDEPKEERVFTYIERMDAIRNALPNDDPDIYYYAEDFDDKYVYVKKCEWGEDTYSETHGRLMYVYDDSSKTAEVSGTFEEMFILWLTKAEKDQLELLRGQYEELKAYKETRERQDKEAAYDAVIESFKNDLSEYEEFQDVAAKKYSYASVEDLQNACYIIRGKYGSNAKPHVANNVSVPVGTPKAPKSNRELLHERYGKK